VRGATVVVLPVVLLLVACAPDQVQYDLVLRGGRVMDPETGLDAVMDVGIERGLIAAVSEGPLEGSEVVAVAGLVVAPGFIDLHAHGHDPFSRDLQVRDGVTAAFELEGGAFPVDEWYDEREGSWRIHFGATAAYGAARVLAFGQDELAARNEEAGPDQVEAIQQTLREGLVDGALGIGLPLQYQPGATRAEIFRMFQTAAKVGVTVFAHVRYAGMKEPESAISAVQEMIADAAGSGGSVHIVHIGSTGLGQMPVVIEMIANAAASGIDVTTEVYPYTAASTDIRSAIFDPGWRERLGADYGDIEWVATGERLDEAGFYLRRNETPDAEPATIIAHIIPERELGDAIAHPDVMIASDGVGYIDGRAHPRGAGTFARVLGRYARDEGRLSLMEAIRKMTLAPARRLEAVAPAMRRKGRLSVGADADITVFNPETVIDRATFAEPALPSAGIPHVLVDGVFVVRDGELVEGALPGRAIRSSVVDGD
jgi:dihydroorotase